MDAQKLQTLYKLGNIESHDAGLLFVYNAGLLDGSCPLPEVVQVETVSHETLPVETIVQPEIAPVEQLPEATIGLPEMVSGSLEPIIVSDQEVINPQ